MSILLFVSLISVHYNLAQRVDVLDVLNYPVLLHVLNEILLLALSDRRCAWRLCNGSVFDF